MRNVLGILLTAIVALGLHSTAVSAEAVPPSWVLYGFEDVDGVRVLEKAVIHTPFNDLGGCITYAIQLPQPKPYEEVDGHKIVHGWTCKRVEMTSGIQT